MEKKLKKTTTSKKKTSVKNTKKQSKKKKKAFTLIELLAVIIILGILMIIAIPSVTSYINNSRKSAYVDTVKEVVAGARNMVNEGKLEMFDTNTTYYIPSNCINTENEQTSPYGVFEEAYVIVTYEGTNYNYYWISIDSSNQGVKNITPINNLNEDSIESDLKIDEIVNTINTTGIEERSKILILKEDCKSWHDEKNATKSVASDGTKIVKLAAVEIKKSGTNNNQLVSIGDNNFIFKGGNPDNYVRFNNELWRVVGIYNDQLKIIHADSIGRYQFDYSSIRYQNSSLKTYLNSTYLNSLKAEDKALIEENGVWNVGEAKQTLNASSAYQRAKLTTWNGAVGIMSTYEFLYAASDENCYNTAGNSYYSCGKKELDWMTPLQHDAWTLTPHYYDDNGTRGVPLNISPGGYVSYGSSNQSSLWIYPSVYLKSSTELSGGNGAKDNPYTFE